MTPVAPAGTGAPVMIRAAVPGRSGPLGNRPAGMSSEMASVTGASQRAPSTSEARTANPSIALLSQGG